ncbi:metallophosphoesterase [Stenotrophomonas sp. ESTM1D_MKCIP4_1]|uniref:metallophosphoesterase n=1 Tax=Stenotrophomonas sp. ESTM1D_MKCIP4_1 TaxID=2072414 RepID=UPI000D5413BC|nr:metallophosphoesterase [Stenotrophomonas sp. ESTM1D_MKCIP4_1]AWH51773.1 metallophosphoesterase [Stenotrophomonas sp. ESTM1D_MKCIP4_1]
MFHVYCFLLFAYVAVRVIYPIRVQLIYRIVALSILLIGSMNRLLSQVSFGDMFSPELPGWIVLAAGAVMGAVLFMAALGLLTDLTALLLLASRGKGAAKQWLLRVRPFVVGIALPLAAIAAYHGKKAPQVNEIEVRIEHLPKELDGLRVVQLSDLHVSRLLGKQWLHDVVVRANALNPDIVVITGDLIDGYVPARDNDISPLGQLRAKEGVFVSLGNHEYYFDHKAWTRKFQAQGLHVLINEHVLIGQRKKHLVLAAVTDEAAEKVRAEMPDLRKALDGVTAAEPIVLLRHRPNGVTESQKLGVDLQLAGHTHGGMILGVDRVVANANHGLVSGMYKRGSTNIYVNNGTGIWNGFPLRLGRPSEITLFTLVKKPRSRDSAHGL